MLKSVIVSEFADLEKIRGKTVRLETPRKNLKKCLFWSLNAQIVFGITVNDTT